MVFTKDRLRNFALGCFIFSTLVLAVLLYIK
jgi:hypothetical protein